MAENLDEQEKKLRVDRLDFERRKLEIEKQRMKTTALNGIGNALIGLSCSIPLLIVGLVILYCVLASIFHF